MITSYQQVAIALLFVHGAAVAELSTIAIVNATGSDIGSFEVRKTGTSAWSPKDYAARSGTSAPATFDTEDCAWDFRLTLAGGKVVSYGNVNLCEVKLVTLHQRNGAAWVEYD